MLYIAPIVILFLVFSTTLILMIFASKLKQMKSASFIRHVAFIVRHNLPLAQSIQMTSVREPTGNAYFLRQFAWMLGRGLPFSEAISKSWPKCTAVDRSIIQAAEQSGTIPDAISIISARRERMASTRAAADPFSFALPLMSFSMCLMCLLWFAVFAVPRFVVVMEDFDVTTPLFSSEILLSGVMTESSPTTWYGMLFHGVIVTTTLFCIAWPIVMLIRAPLGRVTLLSNARDTIRWLIPFFRRAAIAEACIYSLPTIRIAAAAGWPLDRAIDLAASVRTNYWWRRRLRAWAVAVRAGQDAVGAGRIARLPESLLRYVGVGVRDRNFEAPLFAAEQYFVLLFDRHKRAIRMAMSIAATLMTGLLVASICAAILLMLTSIIDASASQWWEL